MGLWRQGILSIVLAAITPLALAAASGCQSPAQAADKTHDGVGTIQNIGASPAYVIIAHEEIPGYMVAMTMQFMAKSPDQLAGLALGDRVAFTFTDKFVLTAIRKR